MDLELEKQSEITKEQLEKINKLTRREMKAEELYVFSVILCDNQVDRDGERFSVKCLNELADLYVGVTGIFDHDTRGTNQTARIFSTEIMVNSKAKTGVSEMYTALKAYVYMVRSATTNDLILEIDGGIKKEVSVGCMVKNTICSVCGETFGGKKCNHTKGKAYGEDRTPCHAIHMGSVDAYEWSFVAVPSQPRAGVTKGKKSQGIGITTEGTDENLEYITKMARIGEDYRMELCREYVRLCHIILPLFDGEAAMTMAKNMPHDELLQCNRALRKSVDAVPIRQLGQRRAEAINENNMFKL